MRCELCASLGRLRKVDDGRLALSPSPDAGRTADCEICGHPLGGPRDRVVETIAQLARFGLTGQMLLSRRPS